MPPISLAADSGSPAAQAQSSAGAVTALPDVTASSVDHSLTIRSLAAPAALWVNAKYSEKNRELYDKFYGKTDTAYSGSLPNETNGWTGTYFLISCAGNDLAADGYAMPDVTGLTGMETTVPALKVTENGATETSLVGSTIEKVSPQKQLNFTSSVYNGNPYFRLRITKKDVQYAFGYMTPLGTFGLD